MLLIWLEILFCLTNIEIACILFLSSEDQMIISLYCYIKYLCYNNNHSIVGSISTGCDRLIHV